MECWLVWSCVGLWQIITADMDNARSVVLSSSVNPLSTQSSLIPGSFHGSDLPFPVVLSLVGKRFDIPFMALHSLYADQLWILCQPQLITQSISDELWKRKLTYEYRSLYLERFEVMSNTKAVDSNSTNKLVTIPNDCTTHISMGISCQACLKLGKNIRILLPSPPPQPAQQPPVH